MEATMLARGIDDKAERKRRRNERKRAKERLEKVKLYMIMMTVVG